MSDKRFIIVLIAVASILCLLLTGGHFGLFSLIAGIILLASLFTYGKEASQTKGEKRVFCMIGATAGILVIGFLLPFFTTFFPSYTIALLNGHNFILGDVNTWLIIFWLIAFLICWRLTALTTPETQTIVVPAK